MAIYRLSIEVLKGKRDSDTQEERDDAVTKLMELQAMVSGVEGITNYSKDDVAPWGVPMRPRTFNIDFDSELGDDRDVNYICVLGDEGDVNYICVQMVAAFIGARGD